MVWVGERWKVCQWVVYITPWYHQSHHHHTLDWHNCRHHKLTPSSIIPLANIRLATSFHIIHRPTLTCIHHHPQTPQTAIIFRHHKHKSSDIIPLSNITDSQHPQTSFTELLHPHESPSSGITSSHHSWTSLSKFTDSQHSQTSFVDLPHSSKSPSSDSTSTQHPQKSNCYETSQTHNILRHSQTYLTLIRHQTSQTDIILRYHKLTASS